MSHHEAKVVCDSIASNGVRITTITLKMPRIVWAEFMTHRVFCLAGQNMLEFELPAGGHNGARRVYKMKLEEFARKWLHGSAPCPNRWGSEHSYDLKSRLREMHIRQFNEATGEVGLAHVVDVCERGVQPVLEVRAGDQTLYATANHRVMTPDGWKTVGELHFGSRILVMKRGKPRSKHLDPLRFKKIDGLWRSRWQIEQRTRMQGEDPMCRRCQKAEGVHVHHLVPVYEEPSRTFDESNITLLCENCHTVQHEKQGWQKGVPIYVEAACVWKILSLGDEPTWDLEISGPFQNFFANKVVVHNSRNAESSRAMPAKKRIARVRADPFKPLEWGENKPGMQQGEAMERQILDGIWLKARNAAFECAISLDGHNVHKGLVNRVLEPWDTITGVVTSTKWRNFDFLRIHPAAEQHIRLAAKLAKEARDASTPQSLAVGMWHLPFVDESDLAAVNTWVDADKERAAFWWGKDLQEVLKKMSAARCARVSLLNHEGKRPGIDEDLKLFDRLASRDDPENDPGHWTPLEHQATPIGGIQFTTFEDHYDQCNWCGEGQNKGTKGVLREMSLPHDGATHEMLCMRCALGHVTSGNLHGWHQHRKDYAHEDFDA